MPLLSNRTLARSEFTSLESEALYRIAEGDSESWAVIVPNRIAQRRLERELFEAGSGRAVSDLQIYTLSDLAGRLAEQAFPELNRIGDSQSAVLLELAIRELSVQHRLDFFERSGNADASDSAFPVPRGTFELILNTIRQLKESGVAPMDIERDLRTLRMSGKETTETRRATDLLAIYEAYQERLRDRFMDTYGQVLLANERYGVAEGTSLIDRDFRSAFPNVRDVFIFGFYYLEPPSIKLITKLAEVEGLRVIIELEESSSNPELFEGLIELESQLIEHGFLLHDRRDRVHNEFAEYLGQWLFRSNDHPKAKRQNTPIQYVEARDVVNEVEEIARRIKLICQSDSSVRENLSRIAVATPSPETYTPLIEEIFRRYEIPVEIADRYHLDRAPLVLAILSLIEMARTGVRKRDVLRVLSSPYSEFRNASDERIDTQRLRDALSRCEGNGNAETLLAALQARKSEVSKRKSEAMDSEDFAHEEAREKKLAGAMEDLRRIQTLVRPLQRELTPLEFFTSLKELLEKLRVRTSILGSSQITLDSDVLELDTRAYRSFMALLEELEALFGLMESSGQRRKIAYYEQRLRAALILRRYSTRPRARVVQVTTLAQSISQPAEYLFLAGLAEGVFPAPYEPQVFLTRSRQKGERKQRLEERVLFYQAITNFTKQLFFSYPKKSFGGAEVNRSNFLDSLEDLLVIPQAQEVEGIFCYRELHPVSTRIPQNILVEQKKQRPGVPWLETLTVQAPRGSAANLARRGEADYIYRGVVDPTLLTVDEASALEANKGRVWSITQLERYAKCPFQFFASDILGLSFDEEREEGLEARDKGSALHEILRQLLISRRDQKPIADVPEHEMNAVYENAQHIAENYFKEISNDHPFWRLDAERLLSEDQPGGSVLRRFIDRERQLGEYRLRPRFFEVSFGGSGRAERSPHDPELSREEAIQIGGFKLRGKIDRIDVDDRDGAITSGLFSIVDYKSGKNTPAWKDIERAHSLQLPLYLRVAEDLLRKHFPELKGIAAAAALYQKVTEQDAPRKLGLAVESYTNAFEKLSSRNKGLLKSPEELRELIDATILRAKEYVDGVAAGLFPLAESGFLEQCKHCAYGSVCRIEEAKIAGIRSVKAA